MDSGKTQRNDSKTVKLYLKCEQLTAALTISFFPEKCKNMMRSQSCMETQYLYDKELRTGLALIFHKKAWQDAEVTKYFNRLLTITSLTHIPFRFFHLNPLYQGWMPFQNMLWIVWMKQYALNCTGDHIRFSQWSFITFKTKSKVNDSVATREAPL